MDDFYAINSPRSREYIRSASPPLAVYLISAPKKRLNTTYLHRALPFRKKTPFATLFPHSNPLAVDLIERCLTFNPTRRITVEGALAHPYLQPYHDPLDEPVADPLPPTFFDFDNGKPMSKDTLKSMSTTHSFRPVTVSIGISVRIHSVLKSPPCIYL